MPRRLHRLWARGLQIRRYSAGDAAALAAVFHASVHHIGAVDYSKEQLAAWSPKPVDRATFHQRVSDGRAVWVAVNRDNRPAGFIELEANGHIDCFYCGPEYAGRGVGLALYQRLEAAAIAQGITGLFVEASAAAQRFFWRVGFATVHRREFIRNGVEIHNYMMTKNLDP